MKTAREWLAEWLEIVSSEDEDEDEELDDMSKSLEARDDEWQARVDAAYRAGLTAGETIALRPHVDAARADGKIEGLRLALEVVDLGRCNCEHNIEALIAKAEK